MKAPTSSSAELQRLWITAQVELEAELERLVRAVALHRAENSRNSAHGILVAQGSVARRQGELAALADLLGRRRLLAELGVAKNGVRFQFGGMHVEASGRDWINFAAHQIQIQQFDLATSVPKVPFKDAIRDLAKREPKLAETAQEVAEVYKEHGFSAVRAQTDTILKRVQAKIGAVQAAGTSIPEAAQVVAQLADWTRAYAHTVVRTNLTTAYAAGRFAQLKDPAVKQMVPALRFTSVQEPWDPKTKRGTRPNHAACHGLIAAVDDPVWDKVAPPLGYNCRCTVTLVTRGMVERMGLLQKNGEVKKASVPPKGGPDAGFTHAGRPDTSIYAA